MALLQGSHEDRTQRLRDEQDLKGLLAERSQAERDENRLIDLYTQDAINLDKLRERKNLIDGRVQGIEERIREIDERQRGREQTAADIETAAELCRQIQVGLPLSERELSFEEKRQLLEALHIKGTVKADGDILVTGLISKDLLSLAEAANKGIMGHELHCDRGSDRGRQDRAYTAAR